MMAELWELVDINKKKTGKILVRESDMLIPEGMYHMVVEIWTKDSNGKILLTQRHPNKHFGLLWEASGGAMVAGEESIEAAQRELKEETGYEAKKIKQICEFYSSPGFTNEKVYLFKAEELSFTSTKLDEDECIETITITKEEAKKMLEAGRLSDSKTIIGILHWINS